MLQRTTYLKSSGLFGISAERTLHPIFRSVLSTYISIWFIFLLSELFSWVPCIPALTADIDNIDDVTKILDRVPYYNKNAYPHLHLDKPTIIYIKMYIEGMSSFRAQTMDSKLLNLIWHPDIYFANTRTAEFHDVTQPNFLVWIYPNGTIWYDCRISLTVLCMQNLARYPLDSQRCALRILSYAYNSEQLLILWNGHNPIEINEEIRMPDMKLKNIIPTIRNDTYATGVWSCALAEFQVDREIMHHIIQSYVPTALIVVISWFSFWLDVEAVPGRVGQRHLKASQIGKGSLNYSAARMALPQKNAKQRSVVEDLTTLLTVKKNNLRTASYSVVHISDIRITCRMYASESMVWKVPNKSPNIVRLRMKKYPELTQVHKNERLRFVRYSMRCD
uniref:Neur_chan_LBD domain-containing protein n=1 Tax=Heterorhabditis bacteriophora TaxID=37862 RepID=A0A1I7XQD0_HETBA